MAWGKKPSTFPSDTEDSPMVSRLTDLKQNNKIMPTMKIHFHFDHNDDGQENEFQQAKKARLQKEIASIQDQLSKFDATSSGPGDKFRKALETELAHKKADLMEFGDE